MNNLDKNELSRLQREFCTVPEYTRWKDDSNMSDSPDSYVDKCSKQAFWLLNNSEILFKLLIKYRRIAEITLED